MQVSIHVRVGKSSKVLAFVLLFMCHFVVVGWCFDSVEVLLLELGEHSSLDFSESFKSGLFLCFFNHIGSVKIDYTL